MDLLNWADAWRTARRRYWDSHDVTSGFTTGVTLDDTVARALVQIIETHQPGRFDLIELGAGDGHLLAALAALRPRWSLTGADLRPAPGRPPSNFPFWIEAAWDERTDSWSPSVEPWWSARTDPVVVIAHEWLDELVCPVVVRAADGWRQELVTAEGRTAPGRLVGGDEAAWVRRWSPQVRRAEIGIARDRAWAHLARRLQRTGGLLIAIDYGHTRQTRPRDGSLVAHAAGRQVPPRPDGSVNLSAGVAFDALDEAARDAGAERMFLHRQRDVLAAEAPVLTGQDPLASLAARSRRHVLTAEHHLGSLWWSLHRVAAPTCPRPR